jgi:hypothetical protein
VIPKRRQRRTHCAALRRLALLGLPNARRSATASLRGVSLKCPNPVSDSLVGTR